VWYFQSQTQFGFGFYLHLFGNEPR